MLLKVGNIYLARKDVFAEWFREKINLNKQANRLVSSVDTTILEIIFFGNFFLSCLIFCIWIYTELCLRFPKSDTICI